MKVETININGEELDVIFKIHRGCPSVDDLSPDESDEIEIVSIFVNEIDRTSEYIDIHEEEILSELYKIF